MSFIRDASIASATAIAVAIAFLISERMPPPEQAWPDEQFRGQLDRRLDGQIEFQGNLEGAYRMLIDRGVPLRPRWSQIIEQSSTQRAPPQISIRLRDATIQQWLSAIEFQAGPRTVTHWLDSTGAIQVAIWGAQPPLANELFDVRDLVSTAQSLSANFPVGRFEQTSGTSFRRIDPQIAAERALVELVRSAAGRGTWQRQMGVTGPNWGESGIVEGFMGITQTPSTLREIAVLLDALRSDSDRSTWGE